MSKKYNFSQRQKKSKKAQMKIQQMIFMVLAVAFFFILAGIFALSFKMSSLKKDADLLNEKNALLLVTKIAESPEFSCGEAFGGKKVYCVDFDKALTLKKNIEKYNNFWGVSNIELRLISDTLNPISEKECSIINYPNCTYLRIISENVTGTDYSTFVSLCRKNSYVGEVYDKCELAKFLISYKQLE